MNKKVFQRLKTKAASLGFNKSELQDVAEDISNNPSLTEESTDEDIDALIDAVIPYLKVGQKQAQRIAAKKPTPTDDGDDDDDDPSATKTKKTDEKDKEPAWFREYREKQEKRIQELEGDKVATTRKSKLEKLLKDTEKFGERTLKGFDRMTFKDEEAFEEYFSEVESDLKDYNKERAEAGLSTLGTPVGGGDKKDDKVKPLTDAEIAEIAEGIN